MGKILIKNILIIMEKLAFIDSLFKPRHKQSGYEGLFARDESEAARLEEGRGGINGRTGKMDSLSSESMGEQKEGIFSSFKNKLSNASSAIQGRVEGAMDTGRNWSYFTIFILAAGFFFFLAFTMLPMILISPGKFTLSFTLGSVCVMLALAFLRNPVKYLKSLFEKDRILVSSAYICSLLLGLYASLISSSYFMTILAICVEVSKFLTLVILPCVVYSRRCPRWQNRHRNDGQIRVQRSQESRLWNLHSRP